MFNKNICVNFVHALRLSTIWILTNVALKWNKFDHTFREKEIISSTEPACASRWLCKTLSILYTFLHTWHAKDFWSVLKVTFSSYICGVQKSSRPFPKSDHEMKYDNGLESS